MINFEYTPRAASETAGLGFQLPIAQRQVGVDVRNADPNVRRRAADASFYEPATDIDTTLTAMRDEYMLGVQELNELSRQAFAKGYDPRSVDYSDANSIEVNRRFTEKIAEIKMKEAQLRQARAVTSRFMQQGTLYDPTISDISQLQGFEGAGGVVKGFNQALTAQGYGEEGMQIMQEAREQAIANIQSIYQPYMEKYANNPIAMQALQTKLNTELASLEVPAVKPPPREARDPIAEFVAKKEIGLEIEDNRKFNSAIKTMSPKPVGNKLIARAPDGSKREIGQLYRAPLPSPVSPATSAAKYVVGDIPSDEPLKNFKYDALEIVPIDKDGKVITSMKNIPVSKYDRFVVLAKGVAEGYKLYTVYDEFNAISKSGDNATNNAMEAVYGAMLEQAQEMTKRLRGGAASQKQTEGQSVISGKSNVSGGNVR